jgi:uncharacterized protein YjbI with pentapeptide repeats
MFYVGLIIQSREALLKGRLSTVDLLVLTSLDRLPLILQTFFIFFTKEATLMRRSTVLSFPFSKASLFSHLDNSHLADSHLADSHLADSHLANSHLAESHLADSHLANSHLAESHLAGSCLANSHLADGRLADSAMTNIRSTVDFGRQVSVFVDQMVVGQMFFDQKSLNF